MEKIIVSFTSFPERIRTINKVLDSIINQTVKPDKIILYLSKSEFQNFEPLPDLDMYKKNGFEIHWYEENLKSHKKWFYAFQEYPDDVIITIDDDILYQNTMIETLLKYHKAFPESVITRRAHLITCNKDNSIALYNNWYLECGLYVGVPRMDLFATTGAGTLFTPSLFSEELFNEIIFLHMCPNADDIWLKIMEIYSGIPVVLVERFWNDKVLKDYQKSGLYENYNKNGGNDRQLKALLNQYPYTCKKKKLIDCLFSPDRLFCENKEAIENKEMEKALLELKIFLKKYKKILVYGAGEMGKRIFYLLGEFAVDTIKAFIVTQLSDNEKVIETISVEDYKNYIRSNEKIVIALFDDDKAEKICSDLMKKGVNADRIIMLKNFEKRALMKKIRIPFHSGMYWQKRYMEGGNSGSGSYGRLADFKAEIINRFVKENGIMEVIEWGCGDGNQLKLAEYPMYTGYDVSEKSIEICRKIFVDDDTKRFLCCEECDFEIIHKGDLAISLDVIYHLVEDDIYEQYMRRLFSSSKKYVCIYSSNFEKQVTEHVKNRKFTDWIDKNEKERWMLLKIVYNKYPYLESDPKDTSWSDFYFYQKI